MDLSTDFFTLFGLSKSFSIDTQALDQAHLALQAKVHPDLFINKSKTEQRLAMQWATHVNEAYSTLRSRLKRAQYLLGLSGHPLNTEQNTAMPADFLIDQLHWREQIADACAAENTATLKALEKQLGDIVDEQYAILAHLFSEQKNTEASALTLRLMFMSKMHHETSETLSELS